MRVLRIGAGSASSPAMRWRGDLARSGATRYNGRFPKSVGCSDACEARFADGRSGSLLGLMRVPRSRATVAPTLLNSDLSRNVWFPTVMTVIPRLSSAFLRAASEAMRSDPECSASLSYSMASFGLLPIEVAKEIASIERILLCCVERDEAV